MGSVELSRDDAPDVPRLRWPVSTPSSWGAAPGYVSGWLARRGARCVGLDNRRPTGHVPAVCRPSSDSSFPLIQGSAEDVPFADGSFDLAISEYGASIWCDPYRWIPEAARLLRPGGSAGVPGQRGPSHVLPPRCARRGRRRPVGAALHRDAPFRVVRRRLGRVPSGPRRHAPTPDRRAGSWSTSSSRSRYPRGHHPAPVGPRRLGPAVAVRGGLESPPSPRD